MGTIIWERCTRCGQEYEYPHLCREHQWCGFCHGPRENVTSGGVELTPDMVHLLAAEAEAGYTVPRPRLRDLIRRRGER